LVPLAELRGGELNTEELKELDDSEKFLVIPYMTVKGEVLPK